ncbi:MAG: hypothetical protein AB7R69_01100 [Candidatus Babeliales bacterium]
MKKHISFLRQFVLVFFFLSLVQTVYGVGGTVYWHNLSDGPGGTSPGVTQNVIDCDIDVIGVNALVDGIHVEARTQDIVITITNGDAVITGSGNRADLVPTNSARLYLFVNPGFSITFQLTSDLLFRGTTDHGHTLDLMVTVSGGGRVEFCIEGDNNVAFSAQGGSGGTKVFVAMQDNVTPKLRFKRLSPTMGNINNNIEVQVGMNSCISYIAETPVSTGMANETGCIAFNGTNQGTGCTILRIQDCSCFVIRGNWLEGATLNDDFLLDDINLAVPAGFQAQFVVENSAPDTLHSSLQVINQNSKCPNLLIDPFCDNAFTGTQYGFILGANAILQVNDLSYLDYIGASTNMLPVVTTPLSNLQPDIVDLIECGQATGPQDFIKERNCSAFFVDGDPNPNAQQAQISLLGTSAIYFRSAVDCEGNFVPSFTIDPGKETPGAGNIVFDVEGSLLVQGQQGQNSALNVLSLQVTKTGCPLFVELTDNPIFPQRTFARDADGEYLQYNKAAFLINNYMHIEYTSLLHTDAIHAVYQNNNLGISSLNTEPTYIGGETWKLCLPVGRPRPAISFNDSIFRVQTGVGITGVDLCVPNDPNNGNTSIFRFYNNGRAIDNAYGRVMILGTNIGAYSACGRLIDNAAHLDIFQKTAQQTITDQALLLEVGFNNTCITQGIVGDISGQCAVHEIYLNNATNISIGTDGDVGTATTGQQFDLITTPSLCVAGEFFSFNSAGGAWGLPGASGTTGEGGIFVDRNGTIKSPCRASFSAMVTRSRNGIIDLPKNQVFFTNRVGITVWKPNLTASSQRVLVPSGVCLSDFTMDWGALEKDYTTTNSFVPYELKCTPNPCDCPAVTAANLRALPIIEGEVNQFQVRRTRIGDQMHLQVTNGGIIDELTFLIGCNPAEAAVGFLVVEGEARVGIGSSQRNKDSNCANVVLGVNGLSICANGNAVIELNEDIIINNVCHILAGTSFGVTSTDTLTIFSEDTKELRVKSTGLLDLSQFNTPSKVLQFAGKAKLVFEPGSKLVLGGGVLIFTDETQLAFERVLNEDLLLGSEPVDLDPIRVKIVGRGNILMEEDSVCQILENQFVGIETDVICDNITSITWRLSEQATVEIGSQGRPGGALQVGNTLCQNGASIDLTIILDGLGTLWEINRQGFMGLGVGVANKVSQVPNQWLVNCLENVFTVSIDIRSGTFNHSQILTGDDIRASLLAVGPAQQYTLAFNPISAVILGGGNLVQITNCTNAVCNQRLKELDAQKVQPNIQDAVLKAQELIAQAEAMMEQAKAMMQKATITRGVSKIKNLKEARRIRKTSKSMKEEAYRITRNVIIPSIQPVVQDVAGVIDPNLQVSILSGRMLLIDTAKGAQPSSVSSQTYFDYLSTLPFDSQNSPRANIFRQEFTLSTVGYIVGSTIRRELIQTIRGVGGFNVADHDHSLRIGAIGINIDNAPPRALSSRIELRGTEGL